MYKICERQRESTAVIQSNAKMSGCTNRHAVTFGLTYTNSSDSFIVSTETMPGYFRGVSLISAVSNVDGNYPLHNRLIDDQGNNRILF